MMWTQINRFIILFKWCI